MTAVLSRNAQLPVEWLERWPRNLEIGSGGNPQPGYLHVELNVEGLDPSQYDIVADACSLPFPEAWFDSVLMFGVFEHFGYFECQEVLLEVSRVLRVGGTFRFDVPNFDWFVHAYKTGCDQNNGRTLHGRDEAWILKAIFGGQDGPGQFHKWGWSHPRILELLRKPNFEFSEVRFIGRQWRDPEENHLIYDCVRGTR